MSHIGGLLSEQQASDQGAIKDCLAGVNRMNIHEPPAATTRCHAA
jgi:hypothetical protein